MEFKRYIYNNYVYRIDKTETLQQVADKFNTSVAEISCRDTNNVYEGDFVVIKKVNNRTHIVKPLETLSQIAKIYNVKEEDIAKNNDLKTNKLFIGQKLRF